jgi:hypothetical protein
MDLLQDAAGDTSKGVARPMQGQFGTINPFKPGAVGSRLTIAAPQVWCGMCSVRYELQAPLQNN